jgi:ATP-binding protein involved in chromosome partitioning
MSKITQEGVINSLRRVNDPDLKKDLVTLNIVKDVKVNDYDIFVNITLTTPACPLKDKLESDCIKAIKEDFPTAKNIQINMDSNVISSINKKKDSILPGVKNTIAVASGKGGVGKSTVAANIAVALAKEGAKVGLIDADIYGPSIPLLLGIKEKPKVFQRDETAIMVPVENYGVKLMSIGFLVEDNTPVIWRGPMASGAVKQFMSEVDWEELDYLFFDMPPGTGDIQLTLCQTIPLSGAVIVTTPQNVSIADARKALKMFQRVNVPIFGIIENMSFFIEPETKRHYNIFGSNGGRNLAIETNVPFLGEIPIDPLVTAGGDKGIPIIYDIPDSEHSKIITEISKNLAAQISIKNLSATFRPRTEILLGDEN